MAVFIISEKLYVCVKKLNVTSNICERSFMTVKILLRSKHSGWRTAAWGVELSMRSSWCRGREAGQSPLFLGNCDRLVEELNAEEKQWARQVGRCLIMEALGRKPRRVWSLQRVFSSGQRWWRPFWKDFWGAVTVHQLAYGEGRGTGSRSVRNEKGRNEAEVAAGRWEGQCLASRSDRCWWPTSGVYMKEKTQSQVSAWCSGYKHCGGYWKQPEVIRWYLRLFWA